MQAPIPPRKLLVLALLFEGGLGVLGLALGWFFTEPTPWEMIDWNWHDALLGWAFSAPLLVFLFVTIRWPVGPLRQLKQFSYKVLAPLFRSSSILDLFLISAAAGFGEEVLFRGFVQPLFVGWLGLWPGVVAASLLFGLMHPFNTTYVLLATAAGVYFGYVVVDNGNLLVPIIAHAVYDFVALLYISRSQTPKLSLHTEIEPCES